MILETIFRQSGTDKFTHGYGNVYQPFMEGFKDEPIQLCEIGVLRGNSLRAWKHYFSNAEIIGFDLHKFPNVEGVKIHKMNQLEKEEMYNLVETLEIEPSIVIEDGGHTPEMHQKTLLPFFKKLKSGGIYIIEDLQVCFKQNRDLIKRYQVTDENNTITYLEKILTESPMKSPYLDESEENYLRENIKSIDFRLNRKVAIITKK